MEIFVHQIAGIIEKTFYIAIFPYHRASKEAFYSIDPKVVLKKLCEIIFRVTMRATHPQKKMITNCMKCNLK